MGYIRSMNWNQCAIWGKLAKINGVTARIYNALSLTTEVTYKIAIQD